MQKLATTLITILALACIAGGAFAQASESVVGATSVQLSLGGKHVGPAANANTVLYDATNYTTSGAVGFGAGGTSSTDLNSIYGDECVLAGGAGSILAAMKFAVFCSGSSTGNLTSATETIRIYDHANSDASVGAYTTSLTALTKGYYSIYTVNSLDALNITLPSTDLIITQQLSSVVGATRMGTVFGTVASAVPAVGTSPAGMYISNSTTTAGFYTFTGYTTNSNAIYEVEGAAPAVPTNSQSWGRLKSLYR